MKRFAIVVALCLLASVVCFAGSWTGYITDQKCASDGKAGAGHAGCAQSCMGRGDKGVLVTDGDGKVVKIANQDKIKEHAGKHVTVTGKLEGDTLTLDTVKVVEEKQ